MILQLLDHYGILRQKDAQLELDNTHALTISLMLNNKSELVEVNGYYDIATNDEFGKKITFFALRMSCTCSKKTRY